MSEGLHRVTIPGHHCIRAEALSFALRRVVQILDMGHRGPGVTLDSAAADALEIAREAVEADGSPKNPSHAFPTDENGSEHSRT